MGRPAGVGGRLRLAATGLKARPIADPDPLRAVPRHVKAPHGATLLQITWADGQSSHLPHDLLRGYCPCAGCQGHSGSIRFVPGGNTELRNIEQIGNYAFGLGWGDGHDSGIFTFRFLRALGDLIEAQGAEEVKRLGELPRL